MKRWIPATLVCIVGCALIVSAIPRNPFEWLTLTGDADGNGHSFTNLNNVIASHFMGDGSQLTNLPSPGGGGSSTNATYLNSIASSATLSVQNVNDTTPSIVLTQTGTNAVQLVITAHNVSTNALNALMLALSQNSTNFAQLIGQTLTNSTAGITTNFDILTNATSGASNVATFAISTNGLSQFLVKVAAHCQTNPAYYGSFSIKATVLQTSPGALTIKGTQYLGTIDTNIAWLAWVAISSGQIAVRFSNNDTGNTNTIGVTSTIEQISAL